MENNLSELRENWHLKEQIEEKMLIGRRKDGSIACVALVLGLQKSEIHDFV